MDLGTLAQGFRFEGLPLGATFRATVVEVRETSGGKRGLVRTRNEVVRQNGDVTLVYNPLRLIMRRG